MSSEVVVVGVRNTTMVGGLLDGLDWTSLLPSDQHQLCTEWQPLNHLYYQVPVLLLPLTARVCRGCSHIVPFAVSLWQNGHTHPLKESIISDLMS